MARFGDYRTEIREIRCRRRQVPAWSENTSSHFAWIACRESERGQADRAVLFRYRQPSGDGLAQCTPRQRTANSGWNPSAAAIGLIFNHPCYRCTVVGYRGGHGLLHLAAARHGPCDTAAMAAAPRTAHGPGLRCHHGCALP